ncbi:MFS transporter [Mycolicibacterium vaccae]|uniref:MFS transporter n=1 Tax=Mycolicibacterium vaccae TaxID=1810 RepID=UPI003CFE03D4
MQRTFYSLVAAGIALIGCSYGFARFAYGLFVPAFTAEFGLTPTVIGVIGAGSYVGYCVAIVAALVLTDRIGARRMAVAAGVVATVGLTVVATAPSAFALTVGILIGGSSTGLASPPLAAAVAQRLTGSVADRAQTFVNAGTGVGVVASGPVAYLLTDQWRLAWGVYAVVAACATGWVAVALRTPARGSGDSARLGGWFRRETAPLLAASLLCGLGSIAIWNFGRDAISQAHTGGLATAAWIALGAAGIAGALGGDLVRRLGFRPAWVGVVAAMSAATVLLAVAVRNPAAVLVAVTVFGAAYITMSGLLLIWSTRVYPESASLGVGLSFFALAAGQALGAPLTGALTENLGYPTAFVVVAAVGATALVLRPPLSPRADAHTPATAA